ncbi:MAG: hypothetical protein ACK5UC_27590 [Planctomycetaceae bacterium]|jgi:hypothetical protein
MPDLPAALQEQLHRAQSRAQALRLAVYGREDPSTVNPQLLSDLEAAETAVADLQRRVVAARQRSTPLSHGDDAFSMREVEPSTRGGTRSPVGERLGQSTTKIEVDVSVQLDPVPTGIYHLLDPAVEPLVLIKVTNYDLSKTRRVCVRAWIEGLSSEAVATREIEPRKDVSLRLLPTLLPERARELSEVQRATLHVAVDDLDGKLERHDTYTVTCLARASGISSSRRPNTDERVDLTHYYGAWVTPHIEEVWEQVRRAADILPDHEFVGYLRGPAMVAQQVQALYEALKAVGITYVHSVIQFGTAAGQSGQRVRLPREALKHKSANCLDGTLLFASLLEAVSLSPALVFVPGHAFVGWETAERSDTWQYLETTMIGNHDFAAACESGNKQWENAKRFPPERRCTHKLVDLRARGIWPME